MSSIAKKEFKKGVFTIELNLIDFESGMNCFEDKWKRDGNGLIVGGDGVKWNCTYFSIGQLNKGNDITVHQAQKEFNRDCEAFDVGLTITVSKNDIELIEDHVVCTDYNWDDNLTPEQLLNELFNEHGDDANPQIEDAKAVLK